MRVCRPGGTIAMANWTPAGFIGQMFRTIAQHIAPANMPSPVLWGQEATVRDRFRDGVAGLKLTARLYRFEYPFPPDLVVEFYRTHYGPVSRAFASLDERGQEKLRDELVRLWSMHNKADGNTTEVDAEYLEVIATRAGVPQAARRKATVRRADMLADRIEQGAFELAAFAEGMSEAEWLEPLPGNATDRRAAGTIVHHVASVYPIEIELARTIAGGKAVRDVTWELVAEMNAKHARDFAGITKSAAIELLRRNSREAAGAVRAFTDEELDRAAPFSLSYGAPVTAQFVIEDHALRHAWHHLARLRAALKR